MKKLIKRILKEQTQQQAIREVEHCACLAYNPTTNLCQVQTATGPQNAGPGPNGGNLFNLAMLPVGGNSVTQVGTDFVPPQAGDRFCTMPGGAQVNYVNTGNVQDCQLGFSNSQVVMSVIGPKQPGNSQYVMKIQAFYCGAPWLTTVDGCTDFNAFNYDINASQDDGSCDYGWRCKTGGKRGIGGTCVLGDVNNPGVFQTEQECLDSACDPARADDDIIFEPADPIDCTSEPNENCWICHGDVSVFGSCKQVSNLPPNWINNFGIPQGFNFYNTESECIAAGPDCRPDKTPIDKAILNTQVGISEDMKRILNEQITEGSCANYSYMYNPNPSPWSWIDVIVSQFGSTANFGDYYTQNTNMNHVQNCCKDENGTCLGRTVRLHSQSPNIAQTAPLYFQHINAYNWKELIDQLNAVHQANNLPTNFTYSDTYAAMKAKLIWSGSGQGPIGGSGNVCLGCTSPVTPPSPTQDPDINPDDGAGDDGTGTENPTATKYECADGQCIPDVNGSHNSLILCQQNCYECTHPECFHCSETVGACINIGSQWSQALVDGVTLYSTLTDCETNEPTCAGGATADTEQCHCCKKNADGTSTLTVMPGLMSVGNCDYFEDSGGAGPSKYTSSAPHSGQGTQHFSGVYHNCAPVTQIIDCGGEGEEISGEIREDIKRMKGLIKY